MKEIELKILDVDINNLEKKLKDCGAKLILKPTVFREYYFEIPGLTTEEREFYSFRLRAEGDVNVLTAKHKEEDDQFNINKEVEINVSSIEDTKELLSILRFKIFRQREKIREIYKIDNIKVMIDKYNGICPYAEIESTSKESVESFVKILGYSLKDTTNKTATTLLKESGLDPNNSSLTDEDLALFGLIA